MTPGLAPEPRTADFQIWVSDYRKATDALGWRPQIDLRTGYQSIVEWVRREESALRGLYAS
jgi:UDP-glucose 4-epimerase